MAQEISFLMPDKTARKDFGHEKHSKAPEGAVTGGSVGAVLGGALGWLAGLGSVVVPGMGAFLISGPILFALSGMAIGGTVGGVSGALIGMGIPEYEAKIYEGKLKEGKILLGVHTDNKEMHEQALKVLKRSENAEVTEVEEATVSAKQLSLTPQLEFHQVREQIFLLPHFIVPCSVAASEEVPGTATCLYS